MSGHGNDFIVIDNRSEDITTNWSERASVWCKRHTSIGADGLLIIEPGKVGDFKLRLFNADGSEAEMCGNGARCAAGFAMEKGFERSQMVMETEAGMVG
ncbi:MAG: diaminopimelate epimerase, partial [Thermodesulfobacteriota bacterium]|nr:diaminopimelate epimerase [Thermodesulfobacteriota bacterium]